MANQLTYGASALVLPSDLQWENEFSWVPLKVATSYSAAGALLLDRGVKLTGRPIVLAGGQNFAWMTRGAALTLLGWASIAGATFSLLFRGVTYTVQFDPAGDSPLTVTPIVNYSDPDAADACYVSMRFITTG